MRAYILIQLKGVTQMPLTKITNKDYLNQLVSLVPQIYSEYLAAESTSNSTSLNGGIQGWDFTQVVIGGLPLANLNLMPTLKTEIESFPSNIHPVMILISTIRGGELSEDNAHSEGYPTGMHRYHIPLKLCEGVALNIEEYADRWERYTWEEGSVYEFENPQNTHFISQGDALEDRTVLLVDIFEDTPPTQEELDLIKQIAAPFFKDGEDVFS
jgi:hypothetical protein